MAVFILSTREPVPEFSIKLKWGIKLIRNWMKWKVLDQKIYCKVLTWIKPADGGSSRTWLTRTEGICRKCRRRVAPNGQTFPGNCSVPPFLHCHHPWHSRVTACPVLHQTNQKMSPFLSQVGFFPLCCHIWVLYIWNQNKLWFIFSSSNVLVAAVALKSGLCEPAQPSSPHTCHTNSQIPQRKAQNSSGDLLLSSQD